MKLAKQLKKLCEEFIALPNSLGISRSEMPQIPAEKTKGFLNYLTRTGCKYERVEKSANELTPSQGELDTDKADKIWNDGNSLNSEIIISKDGYVLDGHHRWFAVKRNAPNEKLNCIQLNYDAKSCIDLMNDYAHVLNVDLKDNLVEYLLN